MSGATKKPEELLGYLPSDGGLPLPTTPEHLQLLRDKVDEKANGDGPLRHACRGCADCQEGGNVVAAQDVRCLLQHIDYLQRELDAVDTAAIDYFGDGD